MKHTKLFISLLLLVVVSLAALPTFALVNASIGFTGSAVSGEPTTCDNANLLYTGSVTGTNDDVGGMDAFAIITIDGNGVVLDNDFWFVTVGSTDSIDDYTDFGTINSITARPVTIKLIDIGDPGAINENSAEGIAISNGGAVVSEDITDPASVFPPCGSVPYITVCPPIPAGSVVGDMPFQTRAYYSPGNLSTVSMNPGTYWVIGVDTTGAFYKVLLGCQFLWVPVESMQPSYQAPQNGAPLPTRVVG